MRELWSKLNSSLGAKISLAIVILFALTALGFEGYAIYCESKGQIPYYDRSDASLLNTPPSAAHWLGTDYLGRDVFARAAAGSATAIKVGLMAGLIAVVIGVTLGIIAGYFGGKIDDAVVWLYSTFASMPTLLFILAFALLVSRGFMSPSLAGTVKFMGKYLRAEPGMLAIYLAIGLTGWVTLCRVIRAETMKLRHAGFIESAEVSGQKTRIIIFRHLLPNLSHLAIIYFSLTFGSAIMSEVIVSYLGIGVQSAPSWGVMISNGQSRLWQGVWWEIGGASLFMFILVLALNLLGDRLRDALDVR